MQENIGPAIVIVLVKVVSRDGDSGSDTDSDSDRDSDSDNDRESTTDHRHRDHIAAQGHRDRDRDSNRDTDEKNPCLPRLLFALSCIQFCLHPFPKSSAPFFDTWFCSLSGSLCRFQVPRDGGHYDRNDDT